MASSGIFPFLSPYCASKRATDIMINSLSNEFKNKNIKIISVKPCAIRTPFWNKSVELNFPVFEQASERIKEKYKKEMQFLKENAYANNSRGSFPEDVAKVIFNAVESANPKSSYTVGNDAFLTMIAAKILPQDLINKAVRYVLQKRTEKY